MRSEYDKTSGQSADRRSRGRIRETSGRAGFTLVELLVAFLLTGLMSLAIYSLFSTTSSSLQEADSLAGTLDGTRFALEQLRSDFEGAAALGTPDMYYDSCEEGIPPCVAPNPRDGEVSDRRVVGLASYGASDGGAGSWQDYSEDVMPSDIRDANIGDGDNQEPEFDGIIVIGAIDFPFTFEVGFSRNQQDRTPEIPADQRGLWKLLRQDVFDTGVGEPNMTDAEVDRRLVADGRGSARILRLMDLKGGLQFAGIADGGINTQGTGQATTVDLFDDHDLHTSEAGVDSRGEATGGLDFGLDPVSQQDDKRYPAALLDVYWYHVVADPGQDSNEATNYLLVRDRLDGKDLMEALEGDDWSGINPNGEMRVEDSRVVVADRVVDFQVWVDCTTNQDGNVVDNSWSVGWAPPKGNSDADHDCLDPGKPSPGEARLMHVRMSRRTETERPDLPANPFPQEVENMQAFDIDPEMEGAARVYTSQVDFELPTFASRNIPESGTN